VQERGAELVQPADCPVQQGADDRLGGRVGSEFVQVALDDGRGAFFIHAVLGESATAQPINDIATGVTPPRSVVRLARESAGQ
jgi:hypothetical protein